MNRIMNWSGLLFALLAVPMAHAATPNKGTVSLATPEITYTAGPFLYNNSSAGNLATGTQCVDPVFPCDIYTLTIDLPANYATLHPDDVIKIEWRWPNSLEDYDYVIYDAAGKVVTQAGTAADPETSFLAAKPAVYTLQGIPFMVAGGSYKATISILAATTKPLPPPASGLAPRYTVYKATEGRAKKAGEPSVGYSLKSKRAMFLAATETDRITFPENLTPALPEACDALWEDVTFPTTGVITLDPILHTDRVTGRTFVSQMISAIVAGPGNVGANSIFAYTDDDGGTWIQGQIGPPEGGYDHQTVGGGPYPASVPLGTPAYPNAVYYCSQAGFTGFCSRSDTGGLTFPNGIPIYNAATDGTGGTHGHVRVAPDGTVYVPNKACGDSQCVTVSEDAGLNWTVRRLNKPAPGVVATPGDTDTSVAMSTAVAGVSTAYFCYTSADGSPHVQVSGDRGKTWGNDYDIGAPAGVKIGLFVQAIAGDPDRAACAFIGTDRGGNHSAADFKGIWYAYVASTYDAGKTWHTVNVTPNDPVQREGGICTSGSSCGNNRNLLDFNEITYDEKGRVIFGYADGCIGKCVLEGPNTFSQQGYAARLVGGRSLFKAKDPVEPAKPLAACLFGNRDQQTTHLNWRIPDSGGSDIVNYKIYRGTAAGSEALIGQTSNAKPVYDDASAGPSVPTYYYKVVAMNAQGDSGFSNTVALPVVIPQPVVVEDSCKLPGITVVTDPAGDSSNIAQDDILKLSIAEPKDLNGKLVFTLKIADLSNVAPNSYYFVLFTTPDGISRYVSFDTDMGGNHFTYGTYAVSTLTTFTKVGDLEMGSGYSAKDGNIFLIADPAKIGALKVGDSLAAVEARVRQGASSATSRDSTSTGTYKLLGTAICAVNTAPLAALDATPLNGPAPLTVTFTAGGSDPDAGDSLSKFSLEFGDGEKLLDQSFAGATSKTLTHTYSARGQYPAKLTVVDSRGLISSNVAMKVIEPGAITTAGAAAVQTGRFGGGALGLGLLLPLGWLALGRRRRH